MNEFYDKDGKAVADVYTKEQVDAMVAEAATPAAAPTAPVVPVPPAPDELPAWAKPVIDQVNTLTENTRRAHIDQVAVMLSIEEKTKLDENYNRLTGYDNTAEGIAARAQAAYLLTTGQQYTASQINMGNMNAAGSGKINYNEGPKSTEADAFFGTMLGITDEDRTKFGKK